MPDADLTFAAEALGYAADGDRAIRVLSGLLVNGSPAVRDSALYGLSKFAASHQHARDALAFAAVFDSDMMIRKQAEAFLEGNRRWAEPYRGYADEVVGALGVTVPPDPLMGWVMVSDDLKTRIK